MDSARRDRKVATNLSVRQDLVARARDLKLNLSEVLEAALVEALRRAEQARWLDENREAIDQYNERVERDGVFSDDWRKF